MLLHVQFGFYSASPCLCFPAFFIFQQIVYVLIFRFSDPFYLLRHGEIYGFSVSTVLFLITVAWLYNLKSWIVMPPALLSLLRTAFASLVSSGFISIL